MDQMMTQFKTPSTQLAASTPGSLSLPYLPPPPGTTPETVSNSLVHEPAHSAWLNGPRMIAPTPHVPHVADANTIRYIPVAVTITPNMAPTDPILSQSQSHSYSLPSQSPSQGSRNDHSSTLAVPMRTSQAITGNLTLTIVL
jgi:hypothetical protein